MQQRHLIFFASLFTVISTTQINYFEAIANLPIVPDPVTIFGTLIILWTNVTDCPPPSCECVVQANVTTDNGTYTVEFSSTAPSIGSVSVSDLKPDTLYSFTLTCTGTDDNATRLIRTDYGRPSAPQNITVTLVSERLRISWLAPAVPNGPIHNYKLTKDRETISDKIPNSESSYDMTKDYVYGETDTFFLSACNINGKNDTVCSSPNDGKDLEPDTMYSFTLSCGGTDETITRHIRTVYGRPSPPRNITATLVSERLRISWLPHSVPNEPIHNYKLANVISGTKINYFEGRIDEIFLPDLVTIFDTLIILWTNVTDCPPPSCECVVQANVTTDNGTYTVEFSSMTPNIGSVSVSDLKPDTLYSFTLTCTGTDDNAARLIRTDYGRPSAPQNITVTLVSERLRISWLPPLVPNGPIHNYKLIRDRETISSKIPNSESSYDMTKYYVDRETDTFFLSACNINEKHDTVCSSLTDGKVSFFLPAATTTSSQQTTTLENASNIFFSSMVLTILIFCFFSIHVNRM
ncbi:unnamed protein product [Rotaria socialis]|uniref:Fibronectin type-III domain-containing protein n=1 Tax=Rotaria socialis TaxID=392032 RepID=A0A817YF97_9BILA|nr:unnamed protein product [Rotaria socialis]